MAPQVPYTGVPTVAPQLSPTPRYTADVTPNTFGANIGVALQQIGQATNKASDEIFARGLAMQDLYNHSQAQEADANYMQKAGELHANFSSLQGKAAVDAYPQYIEDLKKARTDLGDALPNDMARKIYDAQSISTMGRTIFNGAGHAATQNKAYAIGTSAARVQAMGDQALAQPGDEATFQDSLRKSEAEVRSQGQLQGWGPEQMDEAVAQNRSSLWSQRIKGLVKTQPFTAGKMLDDGIKAGDIRGEDIGKLTNIVQQGRDTVGARMVSHDVMSGAGLRWGQGQVDIKQAGEAIGQFESGGNYGTIGVMTAHGRALGKYQVMEENLPEFLAKAGLPSMSADEFLKNHAAQDQVFSSVFGGYMKSTGSFNDAASMWFSGKPVAQAGGRKDALGTTVPAYLAATNAILARNASLADKVQMGKSMATERAPDDPLFGDYVTQRIENDHNQIVRVRRDDEFNNRQTIEGALMGGQDGKLPTTLEQLTADPKVAEAWTHLEPSTQRRYLGVMARAAKGDSSWTPDNLQRWNQYKGQAQNDPATFVDENIIESSLPLSAKKELLNLQQKIKGQATGDPRVSRALSILAPDLTAAGISRKVDKEGYDQFTGALADQLQDFAAEHKKAPSVEEVKTMGSRLLQAQATKGWLWDSNQPMYQVPVPSEEADKIKTDPSWSKLGITPTDQQVQRIYTRKLYQDLYGGKPKAAQAEVPQVPRPQ